MATPTASKHASSQQGRTPSQLAAATPPVSTPFSNPAHMVFSPRGPRSSPQQFKKSPATSTMVAQQNNVPLNFDSPSTAAAMGLAMGGGLDMGLENVGVAGLGALGALASEDEKLKRLESIMDMLNKKKGFVSEAGLERLAQRVGLDCLSEEHITPDGRKARTLVIAGSAIQLDIVLDNNIVTGITLAFPESAPSVTKHVERASKILLKDLQLLPNQSPITKTLDKFAVNLERLAILDKLSIIPGLDCHEALAGIYVSLERLHQWDISKLREEPGMSDETDRALSVIAMCSRHGHPVMHSRDRVGLAIQYWKACRLIPPSNDKATIFSQTRERTWSFMIGCVATDGTIPLPVRVSENWISKDIIKAGPSMNPKKPALDWQEPDNVVLPASEENKGAGMEMLQPDLSTARVPQVMFTVTFDPPIILPQNDWIRMYEIANMTPPPVFGYPPTFDSLFFPVMPDSPHDPSELRTITRRRQVLVYDKDGNASHKSHQASLYIYKQIYSHVVTEMPFFHPRQLIEILPLLRQYAAVTILLENSFGSKSKEAQPTKMREQNPAASDKTRTMTTKDELVDFLTAMPEDAAPSEADVKLDVTLWVHPTPHLQVVFPFRDSTADITLRVLEDGVIEVANENILPREGDDGTRKLKGKELTRADLGRVLEYMEDICKWTEWIRTRLA
ncbi:mediator of RNA polymerase II transcription subunit 1-domain-containing protein [Mariannaea sp. PMI_226]|nr:mediator of RNA polymerase II transcription subunit 1-domain-containing protein [Mariannaea sp. PMI_226]